MSKSNWFPNEKLCLRKIKKNRENSGFDKGKDILQISFKTIYAYYSYFSYEHYVTQVCLLFYKERKLII